SFNLPFFYQPIEFLTHLGPFAIFQPADARRQSLKMNLVLRFMNPSSQRLLFGESFENGLISRVNIFGVSGKCGPTKRAGPAAKQRSDEGRHKARKIKSFFHAAAIGYLSP